jgi:hypothetical protein
MAGLLRVRGPVLPCHRADLDERARSSARTRVPIIVIDPSTDDVSSRAATGTRARASS